MLATSTRTDTRNSSLRPVTPGRATAPLRPPARPPPHYGQPGAPPPPPGAPPQQPPAQTAIGGALTTFGILLQNLPQAMPPPQQWGTFPWPLEFIPPGFLPPGMVPGGQPQAPTGPAPAPPGAAPPAPAPPSPAPPSPAPPAPPPSNDWPADWARFEQEVLAETNARRARGAVCGNQSFGPAGPVRAHGVLRTAARRHSDDMAARGFFDHTNPDGRSPADRAIAAGYQGGFVGENIAGGQTTPRQVVQEWMDSPGHCLNIMDPRYTALGVGYVFRPGARFRHYWTQNFGG